MSHISLGVPKENSSGQNLTIFTVSYCISFKALGYSPQELPSEPHFNPVKQELISILKGLSLVGFLICLIKLLSVIVLFFMLTDNGKRLCEGAEIEAQKFSLALP